MSGRNQGLIISIIGCTTSVDPLSKETSFSGNLLSDEDRNQKLLSADSKVRIRYPH